MGSEIALLVASVAAFGILGIMLGVFHIGNALRDGLRTVAEAFSFPDDEEEEDSLPMDDAGFDLDEADAKTFIEIVDKIAREESA